ncbi:MAG: cytochrome b N-terminal domain-containing protein [Planctomycetota bacterium]
MSFWMRIYRWTERRLGVEQTVLPPLMHPVPKGTGWWYVFGSASLTLFLLQVVSGTCLALVYVPAADRAYESLEYLNYQQDFGWMLRALHFWAASGMVVMVVVHMTQVFLFGAFKYPRELTWLVGVGLLVLTLGMGFSGQVLRWDQDAYWGVGVGAAMVGRVPLLGPALVRLVIGGPEIGAGTLSRFFTLHVFIMPGLLIFLLVVHLHLVLKNGISDPPVPGDRVDKNTYDAEYAKKVADGEPFFPDPLLKDAIFSVGVIFAVVILSLLFGPFGPSDPPDPSIIDAEPRPEWYFLPLFALLALSPPNLETFLMLGLPPVLILILASVPFVAGKGDRSPRRRPVAVLAVILIAMSVGVLGWLGYTSPWSPIMTAWSGTPVPENMVRNLSPLELTGAAVLQNKTCRNCHALDGLGGRRGPDLTNVATRLTHDELIRQVVQGGGNMPAYGKQLRPYEIDALVAFLETLKPSYDPSAQPSDTPVKTETGDRPLTAIP